MSHLKLKSYNYGNQGEMKKIGEIELQPDPPCKWGGMCKWVCPSDGLGFAILEGELLHPVSVPPLTPLPRASQSPLHHNRAVVTDLLPKPVNLGFFNTVVSASRNQGCCRLPLLQPHRRRLGSVQAGRLELLPMPTLTFCHTPPLRHCTNGTEEGMP
uniref:Uncharacterized protein n=1 Tax=Oryza punctata TaxID=4537 RepID=A0A0E0JKL3_ORYPU